jgi:iron complex transport system permease protein
MTMLSRHPFAVNSALLALAVFASLAIGAVFIPPVSLLDLITAYIPGLRNAQIVSEIFKTILFDIRLPHTILMAMTGAALGASGAAYQGLFQNPLADPYLIGVASGAGLGAVLAMSTSWPGNYLGFFSIPVAAFLGALITVVTVYLLARSGNTVPTTTLILAGVAVGSFASALTTFLMFRSDGEVRRALAWLLGGSTISGWGPVIAGLPYLALGIGLLLTSGHALNVLQFGDEQAHQLGLPVDRAKSLVILAATLTTAAAVSFTGIIGFIGLIIPHVIRIMWGPDYRRLIPLSLIGGATALLVADLLARVLLAPQQLPVGVITALAGAPFFLWVLRRYQRSAGRI